MKLVNIILNENSNQNSPKIKTKGGTLTAVNGEILLNGKRINGYEFEFESDTFWLNVRGKADKGFDTKEQLLTYVSKNMQSLNRSYDPRFDDYEDD